MHLLTGRSRAIVFSRENGQTNFFLSTGLDPHSKVAPLVHRVLFLFYASIVRATLFRSYVPRAGYIPYTLYSGFDFMFYIR